MRRMLLGSLIGVLLTASPTFAAEEDGAAILAPAVTATPTSLAPRPELAPGVSFAGHAPDIHRPSFLPALYVGSASLQAFDAYSTLSAIRAGGREQNPLMRAAVKSPTAFVSIKAGVAVASIMAAERLWKNHNRVGAILLMAASNGMMAVVAAHNAAVIARVR